MKLIKNWQLLLIRQANFILRLSRIIKQRVGYSKRESERGHISCSLEATGRLSHKLLSKYPKIFKNLFIKLVIIDNFYKLYLIHDEILIFEKFES